MYHSIIQYHIIIFLGIIYFSYKTFYIFLQFMKFVSNHVFTEILLTVFMNIIKFISFLYKVVLVCKEIWNYY